MSASPLSQRTIVVVEDHADSRMALGLFLGQSGANTVLAANAAEGINAVKSNRPDLVLSDIQIFKCPTRMDSNCCVKSAL
jgi:CheY-like chemotaxis protein